MKLKDKAIFLGIFSLIALLSLQVPFTKLAGSNVSFTLFDFFAPMVGAFLGPYLGLISVFGVELLNLFVKQTPITTGSIIRLFPILFAVFYFASLNEQKSSAHTFLLQKKNFNNKLILIVPILAMLIFWAHPIGREVWYYPLFWTIPIIAYYKRNNLLMKSLGATFTAHSVGGAAWIWAFNLPASVWNSLIPIVIQERLLFALGIAGSYLLTKNLLNFLINKKLLPKLPLIASN